MKKYIFILAQDGDATVDEVMAWLEYEGKYDVLRINDTDRVRFMHLCISNQQQDFEICINEQLVVTLSQIHAYWYRRGQLSYQPITVKQNLNPSLTESMNRYYIKEFEHSTDMLHFMLKSFVPVCINSFHDVHTNKLINLECARQAGLQIPDSIVSNDPEAIRAFFHRHPKCIMKPVRLPGSEAPGKTQYVHYSQTTHLVTLDEVEVFLKEHQLFQPTHFQEYIEKEFEIRSFILNDQLFSMAIFSQQNEKTKIDFRNYDADLPNRNVPFHLPPSIEKKLTDCCRRIGMNCGSIDILYQNGCYYFLEINPVGQVQWLSHNCNYPVEKKLAHTLIGI